ncbi:MAG: helix-turn-helix domain-containing protein [Clostridia bacterium]|nr:helix-turn-helix domain-containing protein [Clostridia bacterium]
MTFSEKIIRFRKTYGLTQEEFAQELEVSRQSVYKWEKGISYPEAETLLKIGDLFSVSLDDLLRPEQIPSFAYPSRGEEEKGKKKAIPRILGSFLGKNKKK